MQLCAEQLHNAARVPAARVRALNAQLSAQVRCFSCLNTIARGDHRAGEREMKCEDPLIW
jgi:hypothetical protein